MLVVNTLERLPQMPDTSCSNQNPTGIALHAHHGMMELTRALSDKTKAMNSTSIRSEDGERRTTHGRDGIEESPDTDTVPDTRNQPTTTEALRTVRTGLNQLMTKPDTSSSESKATGIAHHAQSHTEEDLPELPSTTQESTLIESSTGDHQLTSSGIRESPDSDTVPVTRNLHSITEVLKIVQTGSNKLTEKLDTSSSDINPTGIVHHAHQATEDTQLQELLLTETLESTSIESSTGVDHHGRKTTRE
jgi:hypothetical protein